MAITIYSLESIEFENFGDKDSDRKSVLLPSLLFDIICAKYIYYQRSVKVEKETNGSREKEIFSPK